MKTKMAKSSLIAYYINGVKLSRQEKIVYDMVARLRTCTRKQCAKELQRLGMDIDPSTVGGRANALVAKGLLRDSDVHSPCPITGNPVKWLSVEVEKPEQVSLFGDAA